MEKAIIKREELEESRDSVVMLSSITKKRSEDIKQLMEEPPYKETKQLIASDIISIEQPSEISVASSSYQHNIYPFLPNSDLRVS